MKNGYMFFFNMSAITTMSRIFLVFGILGMINFGLESIMFWLCAVMSVVCFVLNLFHAPTDKEFLLAMEDFSLGFEKELQNRHGIMSMDNVASMNGFVKKGRMMLKRCVERKMIYPTPAILAAIELHGELMVFCAKVSMLKKNTPDYIRCTTDGSFEVKYELDEEERAVFVTITCREFPKGVTVVSANDYHFRSFMDTVTAKNEK